ncbi:MAG: M10 family metallopeptidase C-terminal domain-containing protein [Novosphingobium sp.]
MALASEIQTVAPSGNIYVDSLLSPTGYVPGTIITYVLQGTAGDNGLNGGAIWASDGRRAGFNLALQSWAAVANVVFQEAAGPYTGTQSTANYDWIESFDSLDPSLQSQHDLPMVGTSLGAYNIDSGIFLAGSTGKGGNGFAAYLHAIGRGLGLLDPYNDPATNPGALSFPGVTSPYEYGDNNLNQGIYTAMSDLDAYWQVGSTPSQSFGRQAGPGAFDIAAIQRIYGANNATNAGASSFVLPQSNVTGTAWLCLWDAGGSDTIQAGATGLDSIIDLRAATLLNAPGGGGYVSRITGVLGGFTIANGVTIENATGGSGDDWFHGNGAANVINGGAGFDTVDYSGVSANLVINLAAGTASGDGADTLTAIENARGGSGNDTLTAFAGTSVVRDALDLSKPAGVATTLQGAIDLDYRFSAHTGDPAIQASAGQSSVTVHGFNSGGEDWYSFFLNSAGTILIDIDNTFGIDAMVTVYTAGGIELGKNDDSLALDVGSANDLDSYLSLNVAQGNQRIYVRVTTFGSDAGTYDLNVSAVTTRTAAGTVLVGSLLDGGAGDDTLIGGAGLDTLIGGSGNDSYQVNAQSDVIFENPGEGTDNVTASSNFYLYQNLETLTLAGGAGGIFGVGNDLANTITGNEGDNLLLGGAGDDTIGGGAGGDVLYGESGVDTLSGGDGVDYLIGGIGNDVLAGGNATDALYGEDGNDSLTGGADFATDIFYGGNGDDLLFAASGLGDYDILNGAAGNDSYYVDTPDDIIYEGVGEGIDTVYADIQGAGYYLWYQVDNCVLLGTTPFAAGNESDNVLTGSASNNWLLGNGGNDTLNGKQGNDVLFGDLLGGPFGQDTFVFDGVVGQDVIGDFHHGEDRIRLIGSYADFATTLSHFRQVDGDCALDLGGGNLIILLGVQYTSLTAGDFLFG